MPQGKPAENEELQVVSMKSLSLSVQTMAAVAIQKGQHIGLALETKQCFQHLYANIQLAGLEGWPRDELEQQLVPKLEQELEETGDYQRYRVVWGRRLVM